MLTRYRKWRTRRWWDSLSSEVNTVNGVRFRVTRRKGHIIGVEVWDSSNFGYYVIRGK